jgi:hypothetical protein
MFTARNIWHTESVTSLLPLTPRSTIQIVLRGHLTHSFNHELYGISWETMVVNGISIHKMLLTKRFHQLHACNIIKKYSDFVKGVDII